MNCAIAPALGLFLMFFSGHGAVAQPSLVLTETVTYSPGTGTQGFIARPRAPGEYPGLILIHEWWGLNDNIREFAKRFAQEGYVALAVDLYGGRTAKTPDEARQLAASVRNDVDSAFANLKNAVAYMRTLPDVKENNIAAVGWCFGGAWAYEMAKNNLGIDASVMYYGHFNEKDDLSSMRATILGHFGDNDASIKVDTVKEFRAKLDTLSGEHEIYIYPNAGHAFANEESANYDEEAAETAWTRTLAFLEDQLK